MAAIFDSPLIPTSKGTHTSPTVLLDIENGDVSFGISLQCIQAEIYQWFTQFRFMAAISDSSLPVTPDRTGNMDDMSSELNDLGNLEVAIGIPSPTIHCS